MRLTLEQKNLIEKMGVFQERSGMSPAEARIIALLLIADQTEFTFEEIKDHLQLSKTATSNAINMLLNTNRIEYITHPGDRKRYFKSKWESWEETVEKGFQSFAATSAMLKEILDQRTPKTTEFNKKLKESSEFIDYFHKEMVNVFEKWKKRK